MKSILDKSFRYTPSAATDIRKTFARIRRKQAEANKPTEPAKVTTLKTVKR